MTLDGALDGLEAFGTWLVEQGHLRCNTFAGIPKSAAASPADARGFGPVPVLTPTFLAELDTMTKGAARLAREAPVVFDATTSASPLDV